MGRNRTWRRNSRFSPPRVSPAVASLLSLAITVGFLARNVRIRPFAAAGTATICGFLLMAGLLSLGSREIPAQSLSIPADGVVAVTTPLPAVAVTAAVPAEAEVRLPSEPAARPAVEQTVHVGKGDTLMKLMADVGVDRGEAHEAISALREVYDPKRLRVGQAITLTYAPPAARGMNATLVGMRLEKSFDREAGAGRLVDGRFDAFEIEKQLDLRVARASGTIQNSLFEDGAAEGVPARVMVEFIRLFSYDVDFQRDIHAGDRFDLLFERYHGEEGQIAAEGDIQYASMTVGGATYRLFRFEMADGTVDYFDEKGASVRKELLKTPVDGARISSGFGMRRHPILGYSKMHRGIDFAVPAGTPIMAAGNATISFAGRKGGYGKYIQLRHNGRYSTAYAHMSAFAKGIKSGQRIKQGEVIGYVGSTGRSTGPHLHYEVMEGGDQINPMDLKLTGTQLAGKDAYRFKLARKRIEDGLNRMPDSTLIAQAPTQ